MEITICERWTQYVAEPQEKWYLDWVIRDPKNTGRGRTASFHAYRSLVDVIGTVSSAVEYFGGIGAQSMMIQEFFAPAEHTVYDCSSESVEHIKSNVPGVTATQADSFDESSYRKADLVGLDFGDMTALKLRSGTKHRALLDRVFDGEPKGVVLNDLAHRYFHLHRERYAAFLGKDSLDTYQGYLQAFSDQLEYLYGYHVVAGFYHRWSAQMALSRLGSRASFTPTPETPTGLMVIK